jgi:hypothetical protein
LKRLWYHIYFDLFAYIYIYICMNRLANDTPLFLDQSKTAKGDFHENH